MTRPSADRTGWARQSFELAQAASALVLSAKKAWNQQCKPRLSWRPSAGTRIHSISASPPKTVSSLVEYPSRLSADLTIAPARRRCERPGSGLNISPARSPRRAARGAMLNTPKDDRPRELRADRRLARKRDPTGKAGRPAMPRTAARPGRPVPEPSPRAFRPKGLLPCARHGQRVAIRHCPTAQISPVRPEANCGSKPLLANAWDQ
jgi:hypothetical protein